MKIPNTDFLHTDWLSLGQTRTSVFEYMIDEANTASNDIIMISCYYDIIIMVLSWYYYDICTSVMIYMYGSISARFIPWSN